MIETTHNTLTSILIAGLSVLEALLVMLLKSRLQLMASTIWHLPVSSVLSSREEIKAKLTHLMRGLKIASDACLETKMISFYSQQMWIFHLCFLLPMLFKVFCILTSHWFEIDSPSAQWPSVCLWWKLSDNLTVLGQQNSRLVGISN